MTCPEQPTVAVIGLGLIGGSLARDLAGRGWRIVAADLDPAPVEAAVAAGVVSETFDLDGATAGVSAMAELIVIATPVPAVPELLRWLADAAPPGSTITDVASTKRSVMAAAEAAGVAHRFVGSHPMAGDHRSGWDAARSGLFSDATVWLCRAGASAAALNQVTRLWTAAGADPRLIDAEDHDRLVAWSSHLPQLAASALATALARAGVDGGALGPGGRDATRLAGSDPALWRDIVTDNADLLAPALETLVDVLTQSCQHLRAGDEAGVHALLEEARSWTVGTEP